MIALIALLIDPPESADFPVCVYCAGCVCRRQGGRDGGVTEGPERQKSH